MNNEQHTAAGFMDFCYFILIHFSFSLPLGSLQFSPFISLLALVIATRFITH